MTTTDVTIHLQDIRRPLGLGADLDPHLVNTVLDFLTTHKQSKAVVSKGRLDGLALSTTDTDWSFGTGAEIGGPGEALILAIAGRPTLDELDGPGVELLAERD